MNGYAKARFEHIISDLEDLQDQLQEVRSDVEDEFDKMPYRFRIGSKGKKLEDQISTLEDYDDTLDNLLDDMRDLALDV